MMRTSRPSRPGFSRFSNALPPVRTMDKARQPGKKWPGLMRCEKPPENREHTTRNWFSLHAMLYEVTIDGKNHHLQLERAEAGWQCRLDGLVVTVDAALNRPNVLSLLMNGKSYDIRRELTASGMNIWVGSAKSGLRNRSIGKIGRASRRERV